MDFLDQAYNQIIGLIGSGYIKISPWVYSIFGLFIFIEFLFLGIKIMTNQGEAKKEIINTFMQYFTWAILIAIFPLAMWYINQIFTYAGLAAGGDTSIYNYGVPQPTKILRDAINHLDPLYKKAKKTGMDVGAAIFYYVCYGVMIASYLFTTIQFFLTYIKYFVIVGMGSFLLPFGMFTQTRYIAEKAIGSIFGHALEILLLNFMIAASAVFLRDCYAQLEKDLSLVNILASITASLIFKVIIEQVPAMASSIMSGSPSMTPHHGSGSPAGMMKSMAQAAGAMMQGGMQGVAKIAGGMAKAGASADSAARETTSGGGTRSESMANANKAWKSSIGGSLKESALNLGKDTLHAAIYGDKAKHMNQLKRSDSLENMGSLTDYMNKRKRDGNEIGKNTAVKTPRKNLTGART